MATIFATAARVNSLNNEVLAIDHATISRIKRGPVDGVEITNRAGVTMFLDIDAARALAFILPKINAE